MHHVRVLTDLEIHLVVSNVKGAHFGAKEGIQVGHILT